MVSLVMPHPGKKGMILMIVDSHQQVMLHTSTQIQKMDDAGVDKAVLFTTTCRCYINFWRAAILPKPEVPK